MCWRDSYPDPDYIAQGDTVVGVEEEDVTIKIVEVSQYLLHEYPDVWCTHCNSGDGRTSDVGQVLEHQTFLLTSNRL